MRTQNIIKSDIFEKFSCIAEKCKNTCCKEWSVFINKNDYMKLKRIKETEPLFKKDLELVLKRNKNPKVPAYALLRFLPDNNHCVFHKEGLCALQKELGYNVLPGVCKGFPRLVYVITGIGVEMNLSTSCEAVVNMLINHPNRLSLRIEGDDNKHPLLIDAALLIDEKFVENNPIYGYFWEMRVMCLNILQNRNLTLDERMVHLGFAMEKIAKIKESGDYSSLQAEIDKYNIQSQNDCMKGILDGIEKHSKSAIMSNVKLFIINRLYEEFNKEVFKNFDITIEDDVIYCDISRYLTAYDKMMSMPGMTEYILENFLVSIMVAQFFPFNQHVYSNDNVFENYCLLVRLYSMMKFTLSGYMGEEPTLEKLSESMTSFSRAFLHSRDNQEKFVAVAKSTSTDTLPACVLLINS